MLIVSSNFDINASEGVKYWLGSKIVLKKMQNLFSSNFSLFLHLLVDLEYSFGISIWLKCVRAGNACLGSSVLTISFYRHFERGPCPYTGKQWQRLSSSSTSGFFCCKDWLWKMAAEVMSEMQRNLHTTSVCLVLCGIRAFEGTVAQARLRACLRYCINELQSK